MVLPRRLPRPLFAALALSILGLASAAEAGPGGRPRLGTFHGTETSSGMASGYGSTVVSKTTTRYRLRKDRGPRGRDGQRKGRLYVSIDSERNPDNRWMQAFDVVADERIDSGGDSPARKLTLVRPAANTASGRANAKRLGTWMSRAGGHDVTVRDMTGDGEVFVRGDGGHVLWSNRGSMTVVDDRGDLPVAWDEETVAVRARRGGPGKATSTIAAEPPVTPAERMQRELDSAVSGFRAGGGLVIPKPATQAWEGVNPTTGARLYARGNLVEGLSIRSLAPDGSFLERSVAPDGALVESRLFKADARAARRAGARVGDWVYETSGGGVTHIRRTNPPAAPAPIVSLSDGTVAF